MPRIPWAAIVAHGPAIVAAAKRILVPADDAKAQSNEARIAHLEKGSMDSARLFQEIAQQLEALTVAQQHTARKARIAIGLGVAALVVGIGAILVTMIW